MKVTRSQLDALRNCADGQLFAPRGDGSFVRRPTVDGLIARGLIGARFPHEITELGLAIIEEADDDS